MKTPEPIAHHLSFALSNRQVFARKAGDYRLMTAAIIKHGLPRGLFAFRIADTHFHVLLKGDRRTSGIFAARVGAAIRAVLKLQHAFAPTHFEPIIDQRHLYNAFFYVLRQEEHHGIALDPLLDGSVVADLVGLRVVAPILVRRVQRLLPRVDIASLCPRLAEAHRHSVADLPDAAAAALALPSLSGRSPLVVDARRAAVHALPQLATEVVADALGISLRSVQRMRSEAAAPGLVRAVQLQLGHRAALAAGIVDPRARASACSRSRRP